MPLEVGREAFASLGVALGPKRRVVFDLFLYDGWVRKEPQNRFGPGQVRSFGGGAHAKC